MVEKKERWSNFELLRLIAMFFIIASHWGWAFINSGVDPYTAQTSSWNFLFYKSFRSFGQVGVILFVLISGYFLSTSNFNSKSLCKLLAENIFYSVVICIAATLAFPKIYGTEYFDKGRVEGIFLIFSSNHWFLACYYTMVLFAPFLNQMIKGLNVRQFLLLLGILFYFIILLPSFHGQYLIDTSILYNFVFLAFIYLVGAFLRCFPKCFKNKWVALIGLIVCLVIKIYSINFNQNIHERRNSYVCFFIALYLFILIKDMRIKSKFINITASTTLGVYMLHENVFNLYLWQRLIPIAKYYQSSYFSLISVVSVFAVFVVCALIDLFRKYLLEKPFFNLLDKKCMHIYTRINDCFPENETVQKEDSLAMLDFACIGIILICVLSKMLSQEGVLGISSSLIFVVLCVLICSIRFVICKRIKKS